MNECVLFDVPCKCGRDFEVDVCYNPLDRREWSAQNDASCKSCGRYYTRQEINQIPELAFQVEGSDA